MNTFSNFSTFNGCVLPGSGTWVGQDTEDYYVDENGDLWVPCLCEGTGPTGPTGPTGATGVTGISLAAEQDAVGHTERGPYSLLGRSRIEYTPDTGGDFICVNYPEAILYYPGRSVMAGGAGYPMGMLADSDKGSRWYYKGPHSGRVRLHICQTNMTSHMALWDTGSPDMAVVPGNNVFAPGMELRYAVVLENTRDIPAAVTISRQGGSLGNQPNAAQLEYFRSKSAPPFTVEPHSRKWLYLGRPSGDLAEPGPCRLLQDEARQVLIGTRHGYNARFEALADMELSAPLTITCFAYSEKSKVDFRATSMWPLPRQAGIPEAERPQGIFSTTTGVSPVRQLEGSFVWAIDDSTYGSPTALELSTARGPVPFMVPVAAPAGAPPDLDTMLFAPPPPPPVTGEIRGAGLANQGMVYHQTFVVGNKGQRARQVQYYVTCADPDGRACIFYANGDRALSYRPCEDGPSLLVAEVTVPGGEERSIETYLIIESSGGLGHRLTTNDTPA